MDVAYRGYTIMPSRALVWKGDVFVAECMSVEHAKDYIDRLIDGEN